jgi:hypothetical protein
LHPDFARVLPRRELCDALAILLGFQKFGVSDDLLVVLKLRQFGSMQILTELPKLRIDIVEVNDADRRSLTTNEAQRLKPIPAGDKNVPAVRTMHVRGVCNPMVRIDCANSAATDALYGRIV